MPRDRHAPCTIGQTLYEGRRDYSVERICEGQQDATGQHGPNHCVCAIVRFGWEAGYNDAIWMMREAQRTVLLHPVDPRELADEMKAALEKRRESTD